MNLDIHAAILMVIILTNLGAILCAWNGIRTIHKARKIAYYRLQRRQVASGWWTIFFALVLVGFSIILGRFGEPITYRYFPPSPTPSLTATTSLTPTTSLSPTITLTPTITPTPQFSYTPTATGTVFLPDSIETQFSSIVTPNPDAVFSPLTFSLRISGFLAVNPETVFQNPLKSVFATYSYNLMTDGVQWTAIWYQNGQVLKYRTITWDSGTGGYGAEELTMPADEWLPGIYQLVFFVGKEWKVLGEFRVMGEPPTVTPTQTPTLTQTFTITPNLTLTIPMTISPEATP
jgi:hypothetical protein